MKSGTLFLILISASLIFNACTRVICLNSQQWNPDPLIKTNVISSKWFKVDSSMWTHTAADSSQIPSKYYNYTTKSIISYLDTEIVFHAIIPTPLIPPGIMNSGIVLFYYKDSTGNGDKNRIGKVILIRPLGGSVIQEENYNNYTTATNRLTKSNCFFFQGETDTLGQSFSIKTTWIGSDAKYQNGRFYNPYGYFLFSEDIIYQELPPKTSLFYRYIIIPNAKFSKMKKSFPFEDYNAVLKYYHLDDK